MSFLVAILLAVTLQAPFGEAEAKDLGLTIGLAIDVTVEVEGAPAAVIARITGLAGELDPVALVPRGAGTYGQAIRLTEREDVQIAFEYIDSDGTTTISAPSSLTALGIDPTVFGSRVETTAPVEESGVNPWLLAGVAAAIGAMVLMAFATSFGFGDSVKTSDWTFAGSDAAEGREPDGATTPDEEESAGIDGAAG